MTDTTRVYPGHDYIDNNLRFTLEYEPNNQQALLLLEQIRLQDDNSHYVSTIGVEREINTFFRLASKGLRQNLKRRFTEIDSQSTEQAIFLKLRELRNLW